MPLVFVHGVNNRKDADYDQREKMRNSYFSEIALPNVASNPGDVAITSPYWGDLGAHMAWNNACLPLEDTEAFGGDNEVFNSIWSETAPDVLAPPNKLLSTLARKDLVRAVDCLWAAALHGSALSAKDATALAVVARKAIAFAKANPDFGKRSFRDDDEFVTMLLTAIDGWTPASATAPANSTSPPPEAFGAADIWNRIKNGASNLTAAAKRAIGTATKEVSDAASNLGQAAAGAVINPLVRKARPGLHKDASLFLGDVFQYLDQRKLANGGSIVTTVASSFDKADAARSAADRLLIIVGHSMGGIISYDILSRYRPTVSCDLLVTVGSQVGVFAELGLLPSITIDPAVDPVERPKTAVPANIKRWINVFDPADVFGYSASRIFDRAEDYAFSSHVTTLTAHSMYFERPHFYERLNARILNIG